MFIAQFQGLQRMQKMTTKMMRRKRLKREIPLQLRKHPAWAHTANAMFGTIQNPVFFLEFLRHSRSKVPERKGVEAGIEEKQNKRRSSRPDGMFQSVDPSRFMKAAPCSYRKTTQAQDEDKNTADTIAFSLETNQR